jgi:plasmid stabilization system protein ParE
MAEVIWAVRAYEHLIQIGEYIEKDSPIQARRVVQLVVKETRRLKDNIRIGHLIPEIPKLCIIGA